MTAPLAGDRLVASLERRFVTVVDPVPVASETFGILRPRAAEDLIDDEAFEEDERLPYWADVWPSARVLAARLLAERGAGRTLLELGCGSGVAAVAAVRAGFAVTVTDYYADALLFARANAWRLAGREPDEARLVDWRAFPDDLGHFDVVTASDVLYEHPNGGLVARAFARTLTRRGVGFLTDPGRLFAPNFVDAARSLGLKVAEPDEHRIRANETEQTIHLYTIWR